MNTTKQAPLPPNGTRNRVTLYAIFTGNGEPVVNAWSWSKRTADLLLSDRVANGEAFESEHVVRCTVAFYVSQLEQHGHAAAASSVRLADGRKLVLP